MFVARRSEAFLAELGRHNYVTPTSYLELLATYKQVLALKRDEVADSASNAVQFLNLNFVKMASTRRDAAVTPSMWL